MRLKHRFFMVTKTFKLSPDVTFLTVAGLLFAVAAMSRAAGVQPLAKGARQTSAASATQDRPEGAPVSWAESAVQHELGIVDDDGKVPLRYRQRKVDAKGETVREIIESKNGNVARLLERNGRPITAAEDAAERERLSDDIASPEDFLRHRKRDAEARADAMSVMRLLPQAMIYSYAPGQPQLKGVDGQQVVLDFHPDPAFRPPTMFAEILTGLEGRVWIDERSHCMTRIEARVLHPVNFGFGIVAKIFPGGTVELEQTQAAGGRWVYSHMEEHLTARVLMVKTLPENAVITSWEFQPMRSLPGYQDAIRELLAMPVPLQ